MTIRKSRKSLDDSLASEFVYGTPQPKNEPIEEMPTVEVEPAKKLKPQKKGSVMSQLLESATEREATIRLTVDMPESMHRKLSMFCARTGKKKADVVRLLLDEALQDLDE
jgi:hypothetical protein